MTERRCPRRVRTRCSSPIWTAAARAAPRTAFLCGSGCAAASQRSAPAGRRSRRRTAPRC
nr:MAG TPA: hypothetical protein [Caudoviricetes sp.]